MKLAGAYIQDQKYADLKQLAKDNHRTLADQCRYIFDQAIAGRIKPKPYPKKKEVSRG